MQIKIQISLLLFVILSVLIFSCDQQKEKKKSTQETQTEEPISQQQKKSPDKTVLIGEWTRTDAGYQIKITELLDDGTMKAGYFNPRSINVASALWALTDGVLKIYIELRDENYPGSNYNLIYYPERDLLAGKYFQAVERITYDVGFARAK